MQRRLAVTERVAVLDVVVDQRRLVEALDRHRDLAERVGHRRVRIVLQRLVDANRQERPPPLAGAGQFGAGEGLGLAGGRAAEQRVERRRLEPALDVLAQRVEIEAPRPVVAGRMDEVPDPLDVDRRVLAVVLQQRDRDPRNRRRLHVGERPLQDRDAAYADDSLDLAGLDQRHDEGRSLRHEHGVAEALGFFLQILDGAEAALLAEQAELVERGRAAVLDPQALGHQQQPPVVGHRRKLLAPHLVAEDDADVIDVLRVDPVPRDERFGPLAQLVEHERRRQIVLGFRDVGLHLPEDEFALAPRLRDGLLRRTVGHLRHRARQRDERQRSGRCGGFHRVCGRRAQL